MTTRVVCVLLFSINLSHNPLYLQINYHFSHLLNLQKKSHSCGSFISCENVKYIWENYSSKEHHEIDIWNSMNSDIDKFAMYGDTLSKQASWYKNNPDDKISNYKDLIYVIKEDSKIIGYIISNLSFLNGYYVANINPIVINPAYLRNGYASSVIEELMNNTSKLLVDKIKYIMVVIEKSNISSINLFKKLGFRMYKEEDNFMQYRHIIIQETF